MPNLDVIRNLTLRATATGFPEAAAAADKLAAAQGRVATAAGAMATVTDMSSRRTLSAAQALERLAAKHDDAYRAEQQHARGMALLDRAVAQGLAGTREFIIAQEALAKAQHAAAGAHGEASAAAGLNRMQLMELTHVSKAFFDEIMAGQSPLRALQVEGGRIAQIFAEGQGGVGGTLKAIAGYAVRATTGWVGLSVGIAGAAALGAASILTYVNAQDRMAASLEGVGRRAGMTVGQLDAVAAAGARAAMISLDQGRELAMGYAQKGLDAGTSERLIGASRRFGEITGQGTGEAGAKLGEFFEDPARGVKELDRTFGFLDARLQTTIDRLVAQGDLEGARTAALDAYVKAQAEVTDRSWALTRALRGAETAVGGFLERVGHSILTTFGATSDEDKLATDRKTVANLEKVDPVGNADYIAELRAEIARLERTTSAEIDKAKADGEAARAREESLRVDRAVLSALPEIERQRTLDDRRDLLGRGLEDGRVAGDLGVTGEQLRRAFQNTSVQAANADPMRRMVQDYDLAKASADAFSLAEHAAVDARRAELAVLRETGDVSRAAVAAEIARNEAIAKANEEARQALETSRQNAALVGLTPYERGRQEIVNRYEGFGGLIEKASATRSELNDAMKPVAEDLHKAGETIAEAMREAAKGIAAAAPASPYGTLDRSAFSGGTGAYAQPMFALMDRAIAAGATPAAAAGFAAGTSMESGTRLDPRADNGSHLGVAQGDGPRWRALVAKLGSGAMSTQPGQFDGIFAELGSNEAGAGRRLMSGHSVLDGVLASDAYERPGDVEAARRRAEAMSRGEALLKAHQARSGGTVAGGTMALPVIEVHAGKPANDNTVAPVAATAARDRRLQEGVDLAAYDREHLIAPLVDAKNALEQQRGALDAQAAGFGLSAGRAAELAKQQELLNTYTRDHVPVTAEARAGIDLLSKAYGGLAQAQQDAQQRQRDLVAALDDFRDASKGALSSFVGDMLAGKSATEGLRDALKSIESKLASKLEDTAIDALFGKSGSFGNAGAGGGGPLGNALSSLFSSAGSGAGQAAASASFFPGFSAGGYTGPGTKYQPAGIVHAGEFVVQAQHVPANMNLLHALNTTGRVPGYADGGLVGGGPLPSGGGDMSGGGDLHVHVYGGSGDDHIRGLVHQGVSSAIASNNRALPGMLAERQRRTG